MFFAIICTREKAAPVVDTYTLKISSNTLVAVDIELVQGNCLEVIDKLYEASSDDSGDS
jgi:predicted methyltransferase